VKSPGETALQLAARHQNHVFVYKMLQARAETDKKDQFGETALTEALSVQDIAVVKHLLRYRAHVSSDHISSCRDSGASALYAILLNNQTSQDEGKAPHPSPSQGLRQEVRCALQLDRSDCDNACHAEKTEEVKTLRAGTPMELRSHDVNLAFEEVGAKGLGTSSNVLSIDVPSQRTHLLLLPRRDGILLSDLLSLLAARFSDIRNPQLLDRAFFPPRLLETVHEDCTLESSGLQYGGRLILVEKPSAAKNATSSATDSTTQSSTSSAQQVVVAPGMIAQRQVAERIAQREAALRAAESRKRGPSWISDPRLANSGAPCCISEESHEDPVSCCTSALQE
jgi:hypothetical protein